MLVSALSTSSSWAITNETLLKNCKVFANSNFAFENLDEFETIDAASCAFYIISTIDQAQYNCIKANSRAEMYLEDGKEFNFGAAAALAVQGTSAQADDLGAVTQNFINYAEKNPTQWKYTPDALSWLTQDWPCEIDALN